MMNSSRCLLQLRAKHPTGECYIVIGRFVSRVVDLLTSQEYKEQVEAEYLTVRDVAQGVEIWRYEPQAIIQKWGFIPQQTTNSQDKLIFVVEDEKWRIKVSIMAPRKQKIFQKVSQIEGQASKQGSTRSSSSKSSKKGSIETIKKALKQKIMVLTQKTNPSTLHKQSSRHYYSSQTLKPPSLMSYLSLYGSCIESEAQLSCLPACQTSLKPDYNTEAQIIYGFGGVRQRVEIKKPKHRKRESCLEASAP